MTHFEEIERSSDEPLDDLAVSLYDSLRAIAQRALGRSAGALDGTDLVHEAYVRLARTDKYSQLPRTGFLALCATIVRHLLIEEARKRRVECRAPTHFTSSEIVELLGDAPHDVLELEVAMQKLAKVDERQCRIVELRFYGGLNGDEVAELLGLSRRTVTKEWSLARAWLKRELEQP